LFFRHVDRHWELDGFTRHRLVDVGADFLEKDVAQRLLDGLVKGLLAPDAEPDLEFMVDQFEALVTVDVGEQDRNRIRDRSQVLLALFDIGDVGGHRHRGAVGGPTLADQVPAPVAEHLEWLIGFHVFLEPAE